MADPQVNETTAVVTIAKVHGEPVQELPRDLYIPPDALEVFLETFEGPLDLLLYLIRQQDLEILEIPIAQITTQYVTYIELMHKHRFELAAEYLVMAAMLAEIKSRMLLPKPVSLDEEEEDPRAELIRRLLEYERYKKATEELDNLPRLERDLAIVEVAFPDKQILRPPPEVSLDAVLKAFAEVLSRTAINADHQIERELLTVRERMSLVLERVSPDKFTPFIELFALAEGRAGVVVSLLAILELLRGALIEMVQNEYGGPIYVKAAA